MHVVDDIKDNFDEWVKHYEYAGYQHVTLSAHKWKHIKYRCEVGGRYQQKRPTYKGCTMSENFKDFQFFANWHTTQVGYGLEGYDIDKDILGNGKKVYSEGVCVLVPNALNKFLVASDAKRGAWPQGVHLHKDGKFMVQAGVNGVQSYFGLYDTPQQAAAVYKKVKEGEARNWYEKLVAREFIVDERVIERMRTWTHICDWVAP